MIGLKAMVREEAEYNAHRVIQLLKFMRSIRRLALHPRDFVEKYELTQAQLAELLGVSVQLVKTWFGRENPREPEQKYLDRLAEIDALLEIKKVIDEKIPPHLKSLFHFYKSND
jgi:predicted transcriptional regulator